MKRLVYVFVLLIFFDPENLSAQQPYSERMADNIMQQWKDSASFPPSWNYEQAIVLKALLNIWYTTGNPKYFSYVQQSIDHFIAEDGNIKTYQQNAFNIDNIPGGRVLLMLYNVTGDVRYYKAAALLREQLAQQPRTNSGGFWHKKIYSGQMWLDGLYMGEPFYTEWAASFKQDSSFNDIARQFILMEKHARDQKTGLLYHGWDESRQQRWANKSTGRSPNFWARAMGWYGMALVDVLEFFPQQHPQRKALQDILKRYAVAITRFQDKQNHLWWDVLDKADAKGNYTEASASCMFVYTLAKSVRLGLLPSTYLIPAQKAYDAIIKHFIQQDSSGQINLTGTVAVSGLGGEPYRDGSYAYYINEKTRINDPKGIGAFILAANEIEIKATRTIGIGKTVLLDSWFNNEERKTVQGNTQPWHYKWEEYDNGGFALLGNIFNRYGAVTKTIYRQPSRQLLAKASVYVIVDADIPKENPAAKFITGEDAAVIYNWVKDGGVLLLMGNDTGNAEFKHVNQLAEKFGIHFNEDSRNRVQGRDFATGAVPIVPGNSIFTSLKKLYIKELSTLKIKAPATSALSDKGDVIMAISKIGKGVVFAVGDPWLYNEYVDGRKLPADYENFKAAEDLVKWLLNQSR